jgi:molecular chaperone GrpE
MTEAASDPLSDPDPVAANTNDPVGTSEEAAAATPSEADIIRERDEEIVKLKDMYLRAVAETENVRNRARRENEDMAKFAITKFARDMVALVETLARAAASVTPEARSSSDTLKQVGDGLDMTMQELLSIFERHGIKRINPEGEKFDHNFHQAVAQVENADHPPGTVLQVLQAGYALHDRLLRPAMVTVSTQANAPKAVDTSA